MRTGILGGTFDPIHVAHLHAAEVALDQATLDRVLFMPAGEPYQKADRRISTAAHRMEMVRLAIEGVPRFEADDREVTREGATYTVDTLETFPDDEKLFLVMGADAALGLPTWHRYEHVLLRSTVLVVPRLMTDALEVSAAVPEAVFLDMATLDVSGTAIRRMAASGRPFRFLVPGPVHDYIRSQDLYAQAGGTDRVEASTGTEESS